MPKIDSDIEELLFRNDAHIQAIGLPPMSAEELKKLYHEEANRKMGLAPTSPSTQNRLPVAGFQGTPTAPNQAGGFFDNSGMAQLSMGMGGPSQMPQPLNPMGQAPQGGYQIPRRPDMTLMAQAQQDKPFPRGFTTNIQIGEDGQVSQISLKRALQKKLRGQG